MLWFNTSFYRIRWITVLDSHFLQSFCPFISFTRSATLFLYKASLTDKKAFTTWTDYLHFIPAFINLAAISPYFIIRFSGKEKIASLIIENLENIVNIKVNWVYPKKIGYVARPLFIFGYGLVIFIHLLKFKPKKEI